MAAAPDAAQLRLLAGELDLASTGRERKKELKRAKRAEAAVAAGRTPGRRGRPPKSWPSEVDGRPGVDDSLIDEAVAAVRAAKAAAGRVDKAAVCAALGAVAAAAVDDPAVPGFAAWEAAAEVGLLAEAEDEGTPGLSTKNAEINSWWRRQRKLARQRARQRAKRAAAAIAAGRDPGKRGRPRDPTKPVRRLRLPKSAPWPRGWAVRVDRGSEYEYRN
jgi:hypothetical protein